MSFSHSYHDVYQYGTRLTVILPYGYSIQSPFNLEPSESIWFKASISLIWAQEIWDQIINPGTEPGNFSRGLLSRGTLAEISDAKLSRTSRNSLLYPENFKSSEFK